MAKKWRGLNLLRLAVSENQIPVDSGAIWPTTQAFRSPTSDGHVSLSGTLFDTNGVSNVEVFDGSTNIGLATISNGAGAFSTILREGTHAMYAVATGDAGNTTTTPTRPTIVFDQTPTARVR
jgi:hypothetical protein